MTEKGDSTTPHANGDVTRRTLLKRRAPAHQLASVPLALTVIRA